MDLRFFYFGIIPSEHGSGNLYAAELPDGLQLRVIYSRDLVSEVGKPTHLLHHASISVGVEGEFGTHRRPTQDEIDCVRAKLHAIDWDEVQEGEKNPHVVHLWEKLP